ncbi:MAG TPA: hypothetical protein VFS40_00640 [Gemmatimonadales bacterium]|nr:hypothetical protein [Gemmatimonadales bacterium]
MRIHRLALIAFGLLAATGVRAAAQTTTDVRPRGFYASLTGAAGIHRTTCRVCEIGTIVGSAGALTVGGALSPSLVLAGEVAAGYFHKRYVEDAFFQAGPALVYYPSATQRFWLKAGAGFTVLIMGENDGGAVPGAAFTTGAGYDLPLAGALAASPSVGFRYATGKDVHTAALLAGVGVTLGARD